MSKRRRELAIEYGRVIACTVVKTWRQEGTGAYPKGEGSLAHIACRMTYSLYSCWRFKNLETGERYAPEPEWVALAERSAQDHVELLMEEGNDV